MAEQQIAGKDVERVGVIIVHGIGEQKRFEFLEGETRKIVDAIIAQYGAADQRRLVTPTLTTGTGDAFLGAHSSWAAGPEAPLHILVQLKNGKTVDIAFHEVWWADINESLTLGKQIRFWWWGLSLPGITQHKETFLPGAANRTRPPHHAGWLPWYNRWRMAFVSMLFGFSAFSVALVNMILKRLDFSPLPSSTILVNYLSGVKLYSQDKRAGGSPMDGPDEPPRAAIRRRMIRVMVDVAAQDYKRWYILAHSLGTIVAWNGLMEIEAALPNYLDQERWSAIKGKLGGTSEHDFNIDAMMPNRPLWLEPRDIIKRDALFANFRGILTYGSPLERFCALWSVMVPINKIEDPFHKDSEWVNVYDPTDPVGTWIYDYDPESAPETRTDHTKLKPHNFPCRASWVLLYSHLCYFRSPQPNTPDGQDYLVNQVARWLVDGGKLHTVIETAVLKKERRFWLPRTDNRNKTESLLFRRVAWRGTQDTIVAVVLGLLTAFSLNKIIYPAITTILDWLHLSALTSAITDVVNLLAISNIYLVNVLIEIAILMIVTALAVTIASVVQHYSSAEDHRQLIKKYQIRAHEIQQ